MSRVSKIKGRIKSLKHCVKSVRIRSYSGPYFPAFGLNTQSSVFSSNAENADQIKSEYGHSLRSESLRFF